MPIRRATLQSAGKLHDGGGSGDFGKRYWMLRSALSPAQLWEVCDTYHSPAVATDNDELLDSGASVVFYGAGSMANSVLRAWESQGRAPAYCVDSAPSKWGGTVRGVEIRSPQALAEDDPQRQVVVCAANTYEIEQVLSNRVRPCLFAERDGTIGAFPGHWLSRHRDRFERLYLKLADDQSRSVLLAVAKARMFQQYRFAIEGNVFLSAVTTHPQYFPEGVLEFRDNELFIDGGAFDGDSLISFFSEMQRLGVEGSRAIAFEPDPGNLAQLRENLGRYGLSAVQTICAALGEEAGEVISGAIHNCVPQAREGGTVQVVSLDASLRDKRPTYIKLDIEGSELDALAGSKELVERCRPALAVCTYHRTRHLVDVPLFIADELTDYDIYLRHHSAGQIYETVCYGVPRR